MIDCIYIRSIPMCHTITTNNGTYICNDCLCNNYCGPTASTF